MANHKLERVKYVRKSKSVKHPLTAPGVALAVHQRATCWYYVGHAAALIAAGLCRAEWLPGTAACAAKGQFSIYVGERKVAVVRRTQTDAPYGVVVHFTDDEYEAWHEAQLEKWRAGQAGRDALPDSDATNDEVESPIASAYGGPRVHDDEDDDDWPPAVSHNRAIKVGDGSRWHYLAAPDVLLCEDLLDADEIPGNPACKYRWRIHGWHDGHLFMAIRLGKRVAVTLLAEGTASMMCCAPLKFTPR